MKKVVILGAGGFIGGHLALRLKSMGYFVRGVDIKRPEFRNLDIDEFIVADLRDYKAVDLVIDDTINEVYQLAADMGGAEFVFTGENDADIMHNSAIINLHVCDICVKKKVDKVFYSSSACMYPLHNQLDPNNPNCSEDSAYPANPDSEYGWEKLFSERIYLAYNRNKGLNVRIARFHNIFGPYGTWKGGREKAPAALCRKVIESSGEVELFGSGKQTRSFLYVDECVEGVIRLMKSDFIEPVNIGSDEMVSIDELLRLITTIEGRNVKVKHIKGPVGVQGRNSDNKLIKEKLGWSPTLPLIEGLKKTYKWIKGESKKVKYIYESPDGGKTINRREIIGYEGCQG